MPLRCRLGWHQEVTFGEPGHFQYIKCARCRWVVAGPAISHAEPWPQENLVPILKMEKALMAELAAAQLGVDYPRAEDVL